MYLFRQNVPPPPLPGEGEELRERIFGFTLFLLCLRLSFPLSLLLSLPLTLFLSFHVAVCLLLLRFLTLSVPQCETYGSTAGGVSFRILAFDRVLGPVLVGVMIERQRIPRIAACSSVRSLLIRLGSLTPLEYSCSRRVCEIGGVTAAPK